METLKIDLEQDEVFVFTPKGKVITLAVGRHARRLRLRDPHRGRPPLHRRPGQRPARAARLASSRRATPSRSSPSRSRAPGRRRDWLQFVATPRAAQQDPPVVLPGAPRRRHRDRPRRAGQGAAPRGPAGAEARRTARLLLDGRRGAATTPTSTRSTPPSARTTCRPSRSPQRIAKRCEAATPSGEEQLPTTVRQPPAPAVGTERRLGRRARRGPRRRDGAPVACCTPVPGDEIIGLRHPGPRRVGAPHRLRQRRVARRRQARAAHRGRVGHRAPAACSSPRSRSKALDRAGCSATSPGRCPTPRQHPLAARTATGADRVAKLRFDFELADPGHLDSILSAIKRIDSVYDAYRVLPGEGALTRPCGRASGDAC